MKGPPGSIDTSFGTDGYVTFQYTSTLIGADDVGIVVYNSGSFVRLRLDGSLDPSVNTMGISGSFDRLNAANAGNWLAIDSGGPSVVRFDKLLKLDNTFSASQALTSVFLSNAAATPDGSVILVGTASAQMPTQIMLRKVTSAGAIDMAFGTAGTALSAYAQDLEREDVAIQKDGKIVVGADHNYTPVVARFAADGSVDTSYGNNGYVALNQLGPRGVRKVLVDGSGRTLLLGMGNNDIQIARLLDTGALDMSFGDAGVATIYIGLPLSPDYLEEIEARAMVLQPDGKIVVGANDELDQGIDGKIDDAAVVLVRFDANGKVDTSFGQDGAARIHLDKAGSQGHIAYHDGLAVLSDGRLAVGGSAGMAMGALTTVWQ